MNELSRLKWQCRRGSLELDLLLKNYLETVYISADAEEKLAFVELLQREDAEIIVIMMQRLKPL